MKTNAKPRKPKESAKTPEQIPLAFPQSPTGELLRSSANAHIFRALERDDWPTKRVAVIGEAGSGKSAIAQELLARGALSLSQLSQIEAYLEAPIEALLVVDDFDQILREPEAEPILFHLLNAAQNANARLVMFSQLPIPAMKLSIDDLRSRLGTFEVLEIAPPDDALIVQLLAKGFAERGVFVKADVLNYLATRLGRGYGDIAHAIETLDHYARRDKSKINKALVRDYLEQLADKAMDADG